MGDIGIDEWSRKMDEHKRLNHQMIEYAEVFDKKTANENELIFKEQRVYFWERFHKIPAVDELDMQVYEVNV